LDQCAGDVSPTAVDSIDTDMPRKYYAACDWEFHSLRLNTVGTYPALRTINPKHVQGNPSTTSLM
jgi:hypothetical protein